MPRRGLRKPPPQRKSLRPRSLPPARDSVLPARASAPEAGASAASAQRPSAAPPDAPPPEDAAAVAGHAHADELERLHQEFFSQPPQHPHAEEPWELEPPAAMAHGARRAMYATLVLLGGSLLALGGYLVYARLVMPVPVELGHAAGLPARVLPVAPAVPPAPPAARVARAEPVATAAAPAALPPATTATPAPTATTATPAPTPALAPGLQAGAQAAPVIVPPPARPGQLGAAPQASPESPAATTRAAASSAGVSEVSAALASAQALLDAGRREDAIAAYEQLLARHPDVAPAISRMAYLRLDAGDNERARELAARAVAVDQTSSEGWIVLGAAREALGDHRGAREAYRSCASLAVGEYALECQRLVR